MSKKIIWTAVFAEALLISTGLALAATMAIDALEDHQNYTLAVSAGAFPMLLAVIELFKIPSGIALYKARWLLKPFAALMLAAGMIATMETVTMAGSTWFRALQYEISEAQSDLALLEEARASVDTSGAEVAAAQTVVAEIKSQLADVDQSVRREGARASFAAEWDAQAADNERRAASDNAVIRREAERSQASMPSRANYITRRMEEWETSEGAVLVDTAKAVVVMRAQLAEANAALAAAQNAASEAVERVATLGAEIEDQRRLVAELAGTSIIYDLAAKWYAVPTTEVTEAQANRVTSVVIAAVAFAAAISTGLAAFLATHIAEPREPLTVAKAIRKYALRRRWSRKQTIEVPVYKDRVVYKTLPHPESIQTFDQSVWSDLLNRKEEKSDETRNTA